ncbi:unnamed protein product [Allacma fusca]|uniref:Uncharacterized protein n=1 Tax=Allacma fusca TaxID=39272 RepID=A0A8J2P028_9HEXA|nr:unnamed protein product [Allacma fusca]
MVKVNWRPAWAGKRGQRRLSFGRKSFPKQWAESPGDLVECLHSPRKYGKEQFRFYKAVIPSPAKRPTIFSNYYSTVYRYLLLRCPFHNENSSIVHSDQVTTLT